MAKKKKQSNKYATVLSVIAFIVLIAFVGACYFYPPLYDKIMSFLKPEEDNGGNDYIVEGDTTIVSVLEDLKVHFVDVGQGDCIIIELPDGKNVLIDAGENGYDDLKDYIDNNTGVQSFDYVIATHGDSDHIGNMDKVLQDYEVKYVYRPHVLYTGDDYDFGADFNQGGSLDTKNSDAYGDFLYEVLNEKYQKDGEMVSAGWEFFTHNSDFAGKISYNEVIYEYYFDFLTPRVDNYTNINYKNANDYSPIIKFTYCGVDILFTGDAEGGSEGDAEDEFVEYYSPLAESNSIDLDVDILKVGHHGSLTSTTQGLLDIVKPEFAIIQCGVNNKYHHPRQDTLDRLKGAGSTIFRNDLHGDIVLVINQLGSFNILPTVVNPDKVMVGGEYLYQ